MEDLANRRYPFLLEDQSYQLDLEDLVDLLDLVGLVGQLVLVVLVDRQYPFNLIVFNISLLSNFDHFFKLLVLLVVQLNL